MRRRITRGRSRGREGEGEGEQTQLIGSRCKGNFREDEFEKEEEDEAAAANKFLYFEEGIVDDDVAQTETAIAFSLLSSVWTLDRK